MLKLINDCVYFDNLYAFNNKCECDVVRVIFTEEVMVAKSS